MSLTKAKGIRYNNIVTVIAVLSTQVEVLHAFIMLFKEESITKILTNSKQRLILFESRR